MFPSFRILTNNLLYIQPSLPHTQIHTIVPLLVLRMNKNGCLSAKSVTKKQIQNLYDLRSKHTDNTNVI